MSGIQLKITWHGQNRNWPKVELKPNYWIKSELIQMTELSKKVIKNSYYNCILYAEIIRDMEDY